MHPIIARIGVLTVYSYGIMLFLAFLTASFVVWKKARQKAMSDEKVIDLFILTVTALVVSGRLIYVFNHWQFFQNDLGRIFLLLKYPGLSFGGGITVALIAAVILARINQISSWLLLDIFVLALSAASIFGLFGCYLDGCMVSFAPNVPLILTGVAVLVTTVLELIWAKIKNSTTLVKLSRRPGLIFLSYLIFWFISLLILSSINRKSDIKTFAALLIVSLIVFLVRYREFLNMVKFPNQVLTQIREYLEDRRKDMEKRLSELKKEDPFEDKTRLLDRAADDSEAQSKAGHERTAALSHQLSMALVQTRKALTKIKVGNYGICENCGKMIDTDRLAAMPTANLCLSCEKKKERR